MNSKGRGTGSADAVECRIRGQATLVPTLTFANRLFSYVITAFSAGSQFFKCDLFKFSNLNVHFKILFTLCLKKISICLDVKFILYILKYLLVTNKMLVEN